MLRRLLTSRAVYLLLGLVVVAVGLTRWVAAVGGPAAVWERFGLLAPMVSVPFHALVAITPLPSDVVGVANGTVYGFWLGAVLSWIGWFLASFVQYAIGRRLGHDLDVPELMQRAPARLRRFPVEHPAFLIGSRVVPYAGGHLATLIPGAVGVAVGRFAWCTALAVIPYSVLMAAVGAGLMLL